jgi:hypothetical protein
MAERGGVHCGTEPHLSGMRSLGSGATGQRLNGAWHAADLDASEAALSAYMTAGARAFLKKAQEDHPAPTSPPLPGGTPTTLPALERLTKSVTDGTFGIS